MMPLRLSLVGELKGPDVPDLYGNDRKRRDYFQNN